MAQKISAFRLAIIVELILLFGTFVSGILTAAGVGVTQANWGGICILQLRATCDRSNPQLRILFSRDGPAYLCHFCVRHQIFCVFASFIFALYRIAVLISGRYNIVFLRIVTAGVFGLFTIVVFVNAVIVTAGFSSLCNTLYTTCPEVQSKTCVEYQREIHWDAHINGSSFYTTMKLAEVAAWVSFLLWLSLTIFSVIQFVIFRRANRDGLNTVPAANPANTVNAPV